MKHNFTNQPSFQITSALFERTESQKIEVIEVSKKKEKKVEKNEESKK